MGRTRFAISLDMESIHTSDPDFLLLAPLQVNKQKCRDVLHSWSFLLRTPQPLGWVSSRRFDTHIVSEVLLPLGTEPKSSAARR